MRAKLVVLNSPFIGRQYVLNRPRAVIGRNPECEVQLDLVSVSRQHACIEDVGGRFYVGDLGSRNGVRLADRQVARAELHDGDVITVGEVQLRFEYSDAPAAADSPAVPPAGEASSPRALTGTDIMAAAHSGTRAYPAPTTALETGEASPVQQTANLKLFIAALVGLLIAGLAGIWIVTQRKADTAGREKRLASVLLKVGENQLVSWRRRDGGDFTDGNIQIDDPSVVAAKRHGERQLLLTGRSGGSATLGIRTLTGARLKLRVLVRGRVPDPLEELIYTRLSPDVRRQKAHGFFERGLLLETEKPFLALQEYRKAVAVLKPLRRKGALYLRARTRAESVSKVLNRRWEKLERDIKTAARNNNLGRVEELLHEVRELIPDPNDPRYQMVEAARAGIVSNLFKEKTQRGRR